jgi:non-ribosomal peptide synthetase component F
VLSWNDASGIPLDWNGPVDRAFDVFPDQAKARPIIELLEASVRRFPERVAIVDSEASITYAEIWRASVALAEQIAEATVPGDWVGILAPVSTASTVAMRACLAAGGRLSPSIPSTLLNGSGEPWTTPVRVCSWSLVRITVSPGRFRAPLALSISTTTPDDHRRAGGRHVWPRTSLLASSLPQAAPVSPRASSIRSETCYSA